MLSYRGFKQLHATKHTVVFGAHSLGVGRVVLLGFVYFATGEQLSPLDPLLSGRRSVGVA